MAENKYLVKQDILNLDDRMNFAVKQSIEKMTNITYNSNSNSNGNTIWTQTIPSGVLLSKNFRINGTLHLSWQFTTPATFATGADVSLDGIFGMTPGAFAFNQCIDTCSLTLNNNNFDVRVADNLNVIFNRTSQKYLSRTNQMAANCVDRYFASYEDANAADISYMKGVSAGELDNPVSGRANCEYTVEVWNLTNQAKITDKTGNLAAAKTYCVYFTYTFSEPLLGLPLSMEDDGVFNHIESINLNLKYNDCRNAVSVPSSWLDGIQPTIGAITVDLTKTPAQVSNTNSTLIDDTSKLALLKISPEKIELGHYMQPSYTPVKKLVVYKQTQASTAEFVSSHINLSVMPDKIYLYVSPTYSQQISSVSHMLSGTISKVSVAYDNRDSILSGYTQQDLYNMSVRNGSKQTWMEFKGYVVNQNQETKVSSGSFIIIDPVVDLGISPEDTSGSTIDKTIQITVNLSGSNDAFNSFAQYNLNVVIDTEYYFISQSRGNSQILNPRIDPSEVLQIKMNTDLDDAPSVKDVEEMSGGSYNTGFLSGLKKYAHHKLVKHKKDIKQAAKKSLNKGVNITYDAAERSLRDEGGHSSYVLTAGSRGGSRLDKYLR